MTDTAVSAETDYSSTLFLPETNFPMRAGLPQREPEILARWAKLGLYERLREAIDRSREMYDKRVQPPVAAKFDYFHYEIVNSLADGEAERLGAGYPGSSV